MAEKHNGAKEYLLQVKRCDVHIDDLLEELAWLKAKATKITSTLSPEPGGGSGNQDKLGDAVAKIIDMQREVNDAINAFVDKKNEIRELLEQIQNATLLEILLKVYFQYQTLEQVACEMGYSYKQITRLHGNALVVVGKLLENKRCP